MRQFFVDLLKLLELSISPPPKCHHCITYAKYGSSESGWEDKLALQVNDNGKFLCFFLEDDDFSKTPSDIVADVISGIDKPIANTQYGVGPGQYSS